MNAERKGKLNCEICTKEFSTVLLSPLATVRPGILNLILQESPSIKIDGFICNHDLNRFNRNMITRLI